MKDQEKTKNPGTSEPAEMHQGIVAPKATKIEREWTDETLRMIVEGTVSATGDDFFRSLVCNFARALGVKYAFVAEFADVNTRVRTLAAWKEGEGLLDNYEFDLADTPCEEVLYGEMRHYPTGVQALFPKDAGLVKKGAESYLAIPLIDASGSVLGHLAALDTKAMPAHHRKMSILKIFGARAGAELIQKRAEAVLRESEERLARILESAMDAIATVNAELRITLFNSAAEQVFRSPAAAVVGKPFSRFLSEPFRRLLTEHINTLDQSGRAKRYTWIPEGLTALRADGQEFPIEGTISQVDVAGERLYTVILRDINERKRAEAELSRLQLENIYLQEEIKLDHNFGEIITGSSGFKRVLAGVQQVASTDATVLILGETGTGKELIARAVHSISPRDDRPLVKVNCAALPANLIESELFGHEKGAFTGALSRKIGRFELADRGTIFLDEIGDLPLELQAKLLRVLQEGEFERLGNSRPIKVDVRVIAATNRDLKSAITAGSFREDLFYRLNVFPIALPPLRERKEDIPLLVRHFARKYAQKVGKVIDRIPQKVVSALQAYSWPGNIRELQNIVERAAILSRGSTLQLEEMLDVVQASDVQSRPSLALEEVERNHILKVLEETGWRIEGKQGAAVRLALNPSTLRSRIEKLNIQKP